MSPSPYVSRVALWTAAVIACASSACSSTESSTGSPGAGATSSGGVGTSTGGTGGTASGGVGPSAGGASSGGGGTGTGAVGSGGTNTGGTNTGGAAPLGTPVEINGQLNVCGTKLCNQYDKPIQLRGMSTHGLQWYGLDDCINDASLDSLANDWGADIMRISLYVQEGGYETDPEGFTADVDQIIGMLEARGMYALIDWHMLEPGDPNDNLEAAKTYFTHMAKTHGHKPNVLYEIANEPSGDDVTWPVIKGYAEVMIPLIRALDSDAIVIVGTPNWSSFGLSGSGTPSDVINNQLAFDNVMYTFHFYAASHLDYYRSAVFPAAAQLPIFVTEWGTQEYTGDGPNDFTSSQLYVDWMAENQISWTSWNYSDDTRTGAAFVEGTCPSGPFTGDHLKEAGTWVQDKIKNPPDSFPTE